MFEQADVIPALPSACSPLPKTLSDHGCSRDDSKCTGPQNVGAQFHACTTAMSGPAMDIVKTFSDHCHCCRQPARSRYGARGRRLPKRVAQTGRDPVEPPDGQRQTSHHQRLPSTSPALLPRSPLSATNLTPAAAAPGQRVSPRPNMLPGSRTRDAARVLPERAADDLSPARNLQETCKPTVSPGMRAMTPCTCTQSGFRTFDKT